MRVLEGMADSKGKREIDDECVLSWRSGMEAGDYSAGRECCDVLEHDHGGGCCSEKSSTFPSLSMALEHLQSEKQKERSAIEPIIRTLSGFIHDGGDASNNK